MVRPKKYILFQEVRQAVEQKVKLKYKTEQSIV